MTDQEFENRLDRMLESWVIARIKYYAIKKWENAEIDKDKYDSDSFVPASVCLMAAFDEIRITLQLWGIIKGSEFGR